MKAACSSMLLLLVFGFAACGDGENEEDKVVGAIEAWASTAPAECKKLATQSFVEQTQMIEGVDAVYNCEDEAEEVKRQPQSVEIQSVEKKGSKAKVDVAFTGGAYDGQTLSIDLVEVDGQWKLDEIDGFVRFDRDKLVKAFQKNMLESGSGVLSPPLASCVAEQFGELPRAEFEEVVLGGSPLPIELATENC